MESIIETVASGLGNGVGWLAEHGVLFAVFLVAWTLFAAGVIWSQGTVDQAWQSIRDLPILVQLMLWVLFLPVMVGLWIWESSWPFLVRLVLVLGVAGWNLFTFLPRAIQSVRP